MKAVTVAIALSLSACTTADVACGMRGESDVAVAPMGFRLNVTVNVVTQAQLDYLCHRPGLYGCNTGSAIFVSSKPRFSDVCSLAKLGHEVLHQAAQHGE